MIIDNETNLGVNGCKPAYNRVSYNRLLLFKTKSEAEQKAHELEAANPHTVEEYMKRFGDRYKAGELWDFSEQDINTGAVQRNPDMYYWIINGRYYEVPKEEY